MTTFRSIYIFIKKNKIKKLIFHREVWLTSKDSKGESNESTASQSLYMLFIFAKNVPDRRATVTLLNINLFFLAWAALTSFGKKFLSLSLSVGNRMFLSIITEKKPTKTPQHSGPRAYTHAQTVLLQKKHTFTVTSNPLPLRGEP